MKCECGALLLILIQCIDAFPYPNSILLKLQKREIVCPEGEYPAGAHCCKFCKPGTYAKDDCTEDHGKPDCQHCEVEHYMDADNGYKRCHKCSHCDNALGQEVLQACTESKNTVCRCKETYFCGKNESESNGCTECKHCTKCDYGDAVPCTATKDTVCKSPRHHYWILISAVPVLILFGLCLYIRLLVPGVNIYKEGRVALHSMRRSDNTDNSGQSNEQRSDNTDNSGQSNEQLLILPDELKDIDLTHHLLAFSQKMDFNNVVWVVRKMGLQDTTIDTIGLDYANNHDEQKYKLLKTWYEGHGRMGAFQNLISTLENNNRRVTAEDLIKISKRHAEQSQG